MFQPAQYAAYKKSIGQLEKLFPATFNKEFPLPLVIGVHKQIQAVTGWSKWQLHAVMCIWTARMEYTMMACSTGKRHDLNGNISVPMSDDTIAYYTGKLNSYKDRVCIKTFCVDYGQAFGRPALICVPIKSRPDLGAF